MIQQENSADDNCEKRVRRIDELFSRSKRLQIGRVTFDCVWFETFHALEINFENHVAHAHYRTKWKMAIWNGKSILMNRTRIQKQNDWMAFSFCIFFYLSYRSKWITFFHDSIAFYCCSVCFCPFFMFYRFYRVQFKNIEHSYAVVVFLCVGGQNNNKLLKF